jgi:hypothetical protein
MGCAPAMRNRTHTICFFFVEVNSGQYAIASWIAWWLNSASYTDVAA